MIAKCRFRIVDVGADGVTTKLCAAYPKAEVVKSLVRRTGSRYFFGWDELDPPAAAPRLGDFVDLTAVGRLRRVSWTPNERLRGDEERFAALLASVDDWGPRTLRP